MDENKKIRENFHENEKFSRKWKLLRKRTLLRKQKLLRKPAENKNFAYFRFSWKWKKGFSFQPYFQPLKERGTNPTCSPGAEKNINFTQGLRAHIAGRLNSGFDREIGALLPHIY
jgi:hypothetical protein